MMHSFEYLIKEVEDKLSAVQKALCECKSEKSFLNNNLNSTKETVDESFKRHIGTLQCRAKWLSCHADSIFHLKEGSLTQQISDLELLCNELKSCLEASDCSLNKPDEIRMMVSTVLQNSANCLLQPCENGSLIFAANDNKLEEMIIGFGDIDVTSENEQSFDYDLLTDEGVFVVETCPKKQQDSIEMEVKSIEMHHLTAQSANDEKNLERIEIELKPMSHENSTSTGTLSQTDSAYEEGTNSKSLDEWLYRPDVTNEVEAEKNIDVCISNEVDMETKSDKVPLWLINCEEIKPWIRESQSDPAAKNKFISNLDASAANSSLWLKENQLVDSDFLSKPQISNHLQGNRSSTSEISNIEHFNTISNAPASRYLQAADADMGSDGNLLHYAMNSLVLRDQPSWTISDSQSDISGTSFSTVKSNINHFNSILEAPHSNFLSGHDKYTKYRTVSQTHVKSTVAVDHMSMIENQPNAKFLLRPGISFDPSMCEWLRGKTADRCDQCFDDCGYSTFDEKWIKTATDW